MTYDVEPESIGAEDSFESATDALDDAQLETEDEMDKRFPDGIRPVEHVKARRLLARP